MTPFDGKFANSYALPFAVAAYISTDPPAGFDRSWEILASAPAVAAMTQARAELAPAAPHHTSALDAMLRQPPTPLPAFHVEEAAHAAAIAPSAITGNNLHFGWVTADTKTGILTVAIRGTQFINEWIKDFDLLPEDYKPVPGKGHVHQGFQLVYYAIRDNLKTAIAQALAAYPALHTVLVTGHSLGAAVVGLAAPDLILADVARLKPLVYTFAEPRVGHADYVHFYNATVPVCYRVDNVWDIVPHVPPLLLVYVHEGQEVVINSGFSFSIAHNHQLATGYIPGMAKWVRDHPDNALLEAAPKAGMPAMIGVTP